MSQGLVLGLDPGTDKCGLALVDAQDQVCYRAVIAVDQLAEKLRELCCQYPVERIALGDKTGAATVRRIVQAALPEVPLSFVSEHGSTEEARNLYWEYHPPRGWRRLVPRAWLVPPGLLDAYAAEIIARRLREKDSNQQ